MIYCVQIKERVFGKRMIKLSKTKTIKFKKAMKNNPFLLGIFSELKVCQ